jgi:hypothetical protein
MLIINITYIVPILISLFFFTEDPNIHLFNIIYCTLIIILLQGYKLGTRLANLALTALGLIILIVLLSNTFITGWSNLSAVSFLFILRDIIAFLFLRSSISLHNESEIALDKNGKRTDFSIGAIIHNGKEDLKSPFLWLIITAIIIYEFFLK